MAVVSGLRTAIVGAVSTSSCSGLERDPRHSRRLSEKIMHGQKNPNHDPLTWTMA